MEGNESEYLPQYIFPSNKGKQDLFGEWMDNIEHLDAYVIDKPINMEIDGGGMVCMDKERPYGTDAEGRRNSLRATCHR